MEENGCSSEARQEQRNKLQDKQTEVEDKKKGLTKWEVELRSQKSENQVKKVR